MITRDDPWPAGTPCWIDLRADDPASEVDLYSRLFGWECPEASPESGGYRICTLAGRPAAAIGPKRPAMQRTPTVWSTYLASDDVDKTTDLIRMAGGQILVEPFDVPDVGRMASAVDSTGAAFGVWEARTSSGAAIVNQASALVWNEQMSRDFDGAKAFYSEVFGYTYDDISSEGFKYAAFQVAGRSVGGIGVLSESLPTEVPAHWMTYLGAVDPDAVVARANQLGASVQMGPMDSSFGRLATLRGPEGELFSLISVETADSEPVADA